MKPLLVLLMLLARCAGAKAQDTHDTAADGGYCARVWFAVTAEHARLNADYPCFRYQWRTDTWLGEAIFANPSGCPGPSLPAGELISCTEQTPGGYWACSFWDAPDSDGWRPYWAVKCGGCTDETPYGCK